MLQGGAWRELQPDELAAQMRADGFDGESVRLIACGSGQADGAAARLSRELGVDVKAPTDTVWIHPDGTLTVGPTPDAPTGGWSRTAPDGASEVVEDSARLSDEALEGVDDAVAAGRREDRLEELAKDTDHGGNITVGSRREAERRGASILPSVVLGRGRAGTSWTEMGSSGM